MVLAVGGVAITTIMIVVKNDREVRKAGMGARKRKRQQGESEDKVGGEERRGKERRRSGRAN